MKRMSTTLQSDYWRATQLMQLVAPTNATHIIFVELVVRAATIHTRQAGYFAAYTAARMTARQDLIARFVCASCTSSHVAHICKRRYIGKIQRHISIKIGHAEAARLRQSTAPTLNITATHSCK